MRVAINLLTDDPANPSGAHWFWTRVIPEMAKRLTDGEEFHLLVSPKSRPMHEGYGPRVHYITFPWSNESPPRRTLSEHLYSPIRLPSAKIDVFSTLMAPIVKPAPSLVVHFKTMHAYTAPQALRRSARLVPPVELSPHCESGRRDHHQLREPAPRGATVSRRRSAKLHLIPEAVDHELFRPGDRDKAFQHVNDKIRHHATVRALCFLLVAVQELRRSAACVRRGEAPIGRPATCSGRPRARCGVCR